MKHTIFSSLATFAVVALVTACGSSVKLDEVPVENRTGSVVTPQPMPLPTPMPMTSDVLSKAVAPVEIAATSIAAVGPIGVTKVIYFDYDSFTIKPEFQGAVEAHAKYMAVNKTSKLSVEGHTDERGGREYNLALGQKRAEAVRRSMTLLGVAESQIEAVSLGEEKPTCTEATEECWAKNRRGDILYSGEF